MDSSAMIGYVLPAGASAPLHPSESSFPPNPFAHSRMPALKEEEEECFLLPDDDDDDEEDEGALPILTAFNVKVLRNKLAAIAFSFVCVC